MGHDFETEDGRHRVLLGDCLERMKELPDCSVDAVCCDPPYGLEFMGKQWDKLTIPKAGNLGGFADGNKPSFSRVSKVWTTGASQTDPGIRERNTQWPSFGNGKGANPTCATCGGRKRGAKKCECKTPDWRVDGEVFDESASAISVSQAMQQWHHAWAVEALRVLKPGGHLLAFGGTRTYHRLACAIEDAGFEIRDSILSMLQSDAAFQELLSTLAPKQVAALAKSFEAIGLTGLCCWSYGQGFPKSADTSKSLDAKAFRDWLRNNPAMQERYGRLTAWAKKHADSSWKPVVKKAFHAAAGTHREVIEQRRAKGGGTEYINRNNCASHDYRPGEYQKGENVLDVTAPATPEAQQWSGWGTALKPSFEPIVVARKPLIGTVAENVQRWGCGALNIDATRIGVNAEVDDPRLGGRGTWSTASAAKNVYEGGYAGDRVGSSPLGRWPANLVLSHVEDKPCPHCQDGCEHCQDGIIPGCQLVGHQQVPQNGHWPAQRPASTTEAGPQGHGGQEGLDERHAAQESVEQWECVPGCPCGMFPHQSGGGTPKRRKADKFRNAYGDFKGQEAVEGIGPTSGSAARFFYQSKANRRDRFFFCRDCQAAFCETERSKHIHGHLHPDGKPDFAHIVAHPTVKPSPLMAYLCRMVCRPDGLILDPFGGTGSTLVAAEQEGFRSILIEQDPEYHQIIQARLRDAQRVPGRPNLLKAKPASGQPTLFDLA